MEGLPLLPGYSFTSCDPTTKNYKVKQKLKFLNGFRMIRDNFDADDFSCNAKFVEFDPSLTYGRTKRVNKVEQKLFVPHYVLYERKTLRFEAYFKQGIFGSPNEYYRVHRVNLFYYLEDDTMAVIEPTIINAGFLQGKIVRRHKIPNPSKHETYYHWKDLNVGKEIEIYGVIYRTVNCDPFTKEFLLSQGIDVGNPEELPPDPYMQKRTMKEYATKTSKTSGRPLAQDARYRFLEYDSMILSFNARWDDRLFMIRYFLADNTISVCTVRRPNDGLDMRNCILLKRTKVPKNWKDVPRNYPSCCLEKTDEEVKEYYSPKDFIVGETVFIFGRRFFLYDCDPFTRRYYSSMLKIEQPARISEGDAVPGICDKSEVPVCQSRITREEKHTDLIRKIYNFPKKLRYNMVMDVVHPEDEGRKFILEYGLADGCIRIFEVSQRNSGRLNGCFLAWIRVPRADDKSECYTPEDFSIGAKLNIFGHWFIITGTEPYVYNYMKANPDKFRQNLVQNIRDYLKKEGLIQEDEHYDEQTTKEPIECDHDKDDGCARDDINLENQCSC